MADVRERFVHLHAASLELSRGFRRLVELDRAEQADALQEAAHALWEMRRSCCELEAEVRRGGS